MNIFNTNYYSSNDIPYNRIGFEFAKVYYERMRKGINTTVDLFQYNVLCSMDNDEFRGAYNWLLKMAKSGACKFEYHNLTGASQPLQEGILVNVNGELRVIGLWDQYVTSWLKFNEVFVLEKNGSNYAIKNYMLRLVK